MTVATTTPPPTPSSGTPPPAGTPPAGGSPTDFLATLPEEIRKEPSLQGVKDAATLAKNYVETKRLVGNSIRLPGADAKPEDLEAVRTKLRPETPEGYALDLKPETGWEPGMATRFRAALHKAGVAPWQATELAAWAAGEMAEDVKATADAKVAAEAALQKEWGANYTANLELALRTLRRYASADEIEALNVTGLGNAPWLAKLLAEVGKGSSELAAPGGTPGGTPMSADAAKRRIEEINASPELSKKRLAGDPEVLKELAQLYPIAYGTAPAHASSVRSLS
jgi:hypothetical protein